MCINSMAWHLVHNVQEVSYQTTLNLLLQVIQLSVSESLLSLISHTGFPTDAIKFSQPGLGVDILMFLFFYKTFRLFI